MQTLEEKKALLQRAMDEGLVVNTCSEQLNWNSDDFWNGRVVSVGVQGVEIEWLEVMPMTVKYIVYSGNLFRIVEPRITAEDLCEAIESLTMHPVFSGQTTTVTRLKYAQRDIDSVKELAKRYREQNASEGAGE